jgi:hypothetical protein
VAIKWNSAEKLQREAKAMAESVLNRRLYLNSDKTKVVEEGDTDAAFVFGGEGSTVSAEDVEKYKIPKRYFVKEGADAEDAKPLTTADIAVTSPVEGDEVEDRASAKKPRK